jgi:uncharacterized membrane protein YgdD (TMEM256/DUF423 family)
VTARAVAAVAGFLAVALGAFGAHGLKEHLAEAPRGDWWEKAVLYHLVHSAAMLATARADGRAGAATWSFAAGIVLFSGSLYAMALGAPRWFGAVTPLGGLAFLAGWVLVARSPRTPPAGEPTSSPR